MAKCKTCKETLSKKVDGNNKECKSCRLGGQKTAKNARDAKKQAEELEEGKAKREAAAAKQTQQREDADKKAKEIKTIAADWNKEIKAVVKKVEKLRKDNPTRSGINAGKNEGLDTIDGGTDNPITFELPKKNDLGVTKAEVVGSIAGFDSSDSGLFKFRRGDKIFVHGR